MKNISIAKRLLLAFGAILLLFGVATTIVGLNSLAMKDRAVIVERDGIDRSEAAADLLREVMAHRMAVRDMLLKKDAEGAAAVAPKMLEGLLAVRKRTEPFLSAAEPEIKEAAEALAKNVDAIRPSNEETTRLMKSGDRDAAIAALATGTQYAAALQGLSDKLVKAVQQRSREQIAQMKADTQASLVLLLFAFAAATVAAMVCAWLVTKSITLPIAKLVTLADLFAKGDFSVRAEVGSKDEIGHLQKAFVRMGDSLNEALRDVSEGAGKVGSAAKQLSSSSQTVFKSIETQSESASAMAAALQEMSTSVDHISEISQDARHASTVASSKSNSGANGIRKMIEQIDCAAQSMRESSIRAEELGRESERISSIVNVIKEVADQTNLLALNAAIEAARAGEQGRGFAVVADEVRKLAEKTTKSTKEISEMVVSIQSGTNEMTDRLKDAVSSVQEGLEMARSAGVTVDEIDADAQSVLRVIDEVSSALKEQSAASRDIAARVETVVQMVEENTAAASSMAGASSDMQELANVLRANVDRFQLRRSA